MTSNIENQNTEDQALYATAEGIWDILNGVVFTMDVNGHNQRVSIETINGKKIRTLVSNDNQMKDRVKAVFPEGLPTCINAKFICVNKDENIA